jgi:CHAT domain-containing protein
VLENRYMSRRLISFICLTVLGLASVLTTPALSVQPITPPPTALSQADNAPSLLQQGVERYEAERFLEAAALWERALITFVAEGDRLQQALIFNHLSLAYQQLGRWTEAEAAIRQAIALLNADGVGQSSPQTTAPSLQQEREILAKVLNTQGRLHWQRGNLEDALASWQQAAATYRQVGDETGAAMSLINQATALQTLGFSTQAEVQLQQVYAILQRQSDPQLKAIGLRNLGNALRRVGGLTEAQAKLQESLEVVNSFRLLTVRSATLLDLGNVERALADKAIAIGQTNEAQTHLATAIALYQQAAETATTPLARLQAQLNQLSLQTDNQQWADAVDLAIAIQPTLASLPPSRSAIYALLNFSRSVMALQGNQDGPLSSQSLAQLLMNAIQHARQLNDTTAESYGLGQLGSLYETHGQWTEAQALTQQALLKADAVQSADVRYRWEWQLGRLRAKQGDKLGAIAAYTEAVASLNSIRSNLLLISTDVQFSFRDDVEPVYRELVELLLTSTPGQPSQDYLKQAIQQVNALQLAELENFLGCDIAQTVELSQVEVDPTAIKLYPIILQERLAVILEPPGQRQNLIYYETLKPRQDVEATLHQLRQDLSEPDRTPEAIAGLRQLYNWLIGPAKLQLQNSPEVSTLVFVLDGELRNIPMSALYDGERYLIQNYAVALAPRLELFNPNPRPRNLTVFLGGVGEPQQVNNRAFTEIEYLNPELNQIRQIVDANPPLLNAEFTKTNLEQQLKAGRFSAIHLKTHGVFSSDPEETFIVAYRELITGRDLGRLIQTARNQETNPIELLVLSACSTAKGDNRAVLGLAGIAVQAGARSVLSTLWDAEDLPNTQLMVQFYQELQNVDNTRSQALRQAQLHLIGQGYSTPHIWANYTLIGNWL